MDYNEILQFLDGRGNPKLVCPDSTSYWTVVGDDTHVHGKDVVE